MKDFFRKNKINIIKVAVALIFVLGVTAIVKYDYSLYDTPIGKVISVETELEQAGVGDTEDYYVQKMQIKVLNGEYKGHVFTYYNKFYYSQFNTTRYEVGNDLFLTIFESELEDGTTSPELAGDDTTSPDDDSLTMRISKSKLDYYLAFIVAVFIAFLVLLAGRRGMLILFTVILNIGIYIAGIYRYIDGRYIELTTFVLTFFFIIITLLMLNGMKRKTLGAILSSFTTVIFIYIIIKLVFAFTEKPMFELMDFIIGNEPLEPLYLSSVLLGSLGAIMDVAITINSSVSEISETAIEPTAASLFSSVKEISYDIMGTMINVLFFTFLSSGIPMFVLLIKNGYALSTIMNLNVVFDEIRFLIGAIGIVLAIPVSGAISILLFRNPKRDMIRGGVE